MWAEASVFGSSVMRVKCGGERSLSRHVTRWSESVERTSIPKFLGMCVCEERE